MYHEVSKPIPGDSQSNYMTPRYDVPVAMFEKQIELLHKYGYRCLLFEDISKIREPGRYVMITFDDGLKGNFSHALPVLQKYDFKATFFVTVGAIGRERFMNWSELKELIDSGMAVQSHTMSHRPLETLERDDIRRELGESKKALEKKLHTTVSLLSFPHGSYNTCVLKMASEFGYKALFTSDVQFPRQKEFFNEPAVIGRIAMTNLLTLKKFSRIVAGDKLEIFKQKAAKSVKSSVRSLIGIENYRYLYRIIFNIRKTDT